VRVRHGKSPCDSIGKSTYLYYPGKVVPTRRSPSGWHTISPRRQLLDVSAPIDIGNGSELRHTAFGQPYRPATGCSRYTVQLLPWALHQNSSRKSLPSRMARDIAILYKIQLVYRLCQGNRGRRGSGMGRKDKRKRWRRKPMRAAGSSWASSQ
jgi:hypothetical protein